MRSAMGSLTDPLTLLRDFTRAKKKVERKRRDLVNASEHRLAELEREVLTAKRTKASTRAIMELEERVEAEKEVARKINEDADERLSAAAERFAVDFKLYKAKRDKAKFKGRGPMMRAARKKTPEFQDRKVVCKSFLKDKYVEDAIVAVKTQIITDFALTRRIMNNFAKIMVLP